MTKKTEHTPDIREKKDETSTVDGIHRRDLLKMGAAGLGMAALGACAPRAEEGPTKPLIQRTGAW